MNAKVKVPTGAATKQKVSNLPLAGQSIKLAAQNGPSLGVGGQNGGQQTGGNLQHPSHARKLAEGKLTSSKAGLGQHKYTNSSGGGG